MIHRTHGVFGAVVIHDIQRQIERMRADVDERPAPLLFFVQKYAPGRNGAAADRLGAREIYLAERTLFRFFFEIFYFGAIAVLIADGQDFTALRLGVEHGFRLLVIDRHRFFADDVFACIERRNGDLAVRNIGRTHAHRVQILF